MNPPLIVTRDDTLLEELLRLAAAAGVTPEVARDPGAALRSWTSAPLVLLGADVAAEAARLAPPPRDGLHILTWGGSPDAIFRTAVDVGADSVTDLPRSDAWVIETLTDLGDHGAARGLTIGVTGGSGGAGATTFACALGQVAARSGLSVVVDVDPLGPGIDRVLGVETREGVRWDALGQTTGRLSARSLREALPRRAGVGVLTWYAGTRAALPAFAVREALSAAQRGHDTVVVDLPRTGDPLTEEVAARCDLLLVVVTPTVAGVASAARLCARFPDPGGVRLVVRGRGLAAREVARATGAPVLVEMTDQRGLDEGIDLGLGPVRSRRGPLGRAAGAVLDRVALSRAAA
ncbi:septum site-determining protein Ssd [Nocardioides dongkuii]|uniref:septum site-determining protein Ssd n=1 Tax=Nocardioides dongkuii TaxID=2760089 RepID=UPI0015F803A5|nr:septum site-determining protein Ssd [Nocardioides dongkuii]